MKNFFREYFYFSRGERNGTLIMVMIIFLFFIFPTIYNKFKKSTAYHPDPAFIKEVHAFYNLPVRENQDVNLLSGKTTVKQSPVPDKSYMQQSEITGKSNQKYPQEPDEIIPASDKAGKSGIMKIDINSADTAELMMIRGIGPVLSRRILKYRDILGGYYDVAQLLEVYGIDEETYHEAKLFVLADTSHIVKLCPLSDEFGVLLRHPYLGYEQVSEIFRLRSQNKLSVPADLLESDAFNEENLIRISPYFINEFKKK